MQVTRRSALNALALAAGTALALPLLTRRIEDELRDVLDRNFGSKISMSSEADLFIEDMAELWRSIETASGQIWKPSFWMLEPLLPAARTARNDIEQAVLAVFLRSSNVIQVFEQGEGELIYLGMPDPYANPCSNPLSSAWL